MDITSVHKYISLNKQANGSTEVLFSGQPCLTVSEGFMGNIWKINPVFAKLVYGANIFEDIPQCSEGSDTTEEAIAAGLLKLHELGAFTTEVDLPEDSYAATMNDIAEDVKKYTTKNSKNIIEACVKYAHIMESIKNNTFPIIEDRTEYTANIGLAATDPKKLGQKSIVLKHPSGEILSRHNNEGDAIRAFKNLKDTKGVKIVTEEIDITEISVPEINAENTVIESAIKKDKKFNSSGE